MSRKNKWMRIGLTIVVGGFLMLNQSVAQEYFRIAADFTVKVKKSDGSLNLTRGKVFYDKNFNELIYEVSFPQPEKWILKDTSLIKVRQDTIFDRASIPSVNEFTVFHLALNSNLNDFGLKNSIYQISKVEKKKDLTLSYWQIPAQASTLLDHVVIAKKNNRLESVVMVANEQNIISRQFFRDYEKTGAFEFPRQIVQILYNENGEENYQITEFKNIVVNDLANSAMYQSNY